MNCFLLDVYLYIIFILMESENIDQEIQAKQQLLQNEIIEKNYDKGSFINFCLSKRENGDDLNNWTLSELEAIVKEFVSTQNVQTVSQEQKNAEGEEINKENLEKMEKFNAEEPKNFKEKVIECRKLEKSELNDAVNDSGDLGKDILNANDDNKDKNAGGNKK